MQELNPIQWAILPLKKYATFSGRAPRAEYWWFTLANIIVGIGADFLDPLVGGPVIGIYGPLSLALTLALVFPGVSVTVRRLHDINRSGWWILLDLWNYSFILAGFSRFSMVAAMERMGAAAAVILILVMFVCGVILFVFLVSRGTKGSNEYGPDPYGPSELEEVFA